MAVFLYKITNLFNGKAYIGVAQDPNKRFEVHCKESNPSVIARAIRKYKRDSFEFKIISVVPDHHIAFCLERYCITKYGTLAPNGYNMTGGGEGGDTLTSIGYKHSEEIKRSISERRKGIPTTLGMKTSEETKVKISKANKGKKRTKEFCNFISEMHTGNKYKLGTKATKDTRAKMSAAHIGNKSHTGRTFSNEHRQNISEANSGEKNGFYGKAHSKEALKQISNTHKGNTYRLGAKLSEETKDKISNSLKGRAPWNKGLKLTNRKRSS